MYGAAVMEVAPGVDDPELTISKQSVRVDGEQPATEVSSGTTQAAQGECEGLGLLDRMSREQIVNGLIGSYERQAIEEFESLLSEATGGPQVQDAEGCFVD